MVTRPTIVVLSLVLATSAAGQESAALDPGGMMCPIMSSTPRIRMSVPVEQLRAAALRDSNDAAAHYELGLGYFSRNCLNQAERSFRTAIAIEPRFPAAYVALAFLPYARQPSLWSRPPIGATSEGVDRTLEESFRLRRHAVLLDPLVDLRVMNAVLPPVITYTRTPRETAIVVGIRMVMDGNYQLSLTRFADYLKENARARTPEQPPNAFFYFRGMARAQLGQLDSAIVDFDQLLAFSLSQEQSDSASLQLVSGSNQYRHILATLLLKAGNLDRAEREFREAVEADLGLFIAHVHLAQIHERRGNWDLALEERRRALETNPEDASLLIDLGITFFKAGRLAGADSALASAEQLLPRNYRVAYYQGLVAMQQNEPPRARAAFRRFLVLVPSRFGAQAQEVQRLLSQLP